MKRGLFAAAVALGACLALLGSQPLWLPAILALLVFPLAAAVADGRVREERKRRGAIALTALAGGLLIALAIRLAVDAPDWLSATAADCGGPSTATQQTVLTGAAMIFAAAAAAVAVNVLSIGRRVGATADRGTSDREAPALAPLSLYPVAVAASGIALIASSYVTAC